MDLFKVIIAPKAMEQLEEYIDYVQYTLLNPQAAKAVYEDAVKTLNILATVASSLRYCAHPKLKAKGYRTIKFLKHRYLMVYLVIGSNVYVEGIYHQLQDYENTFAESI